MVYCFVIQYKMCMPFMLTVKYRKGEEGVISDLVISKKVLYCNAQEFDVQEKQDETHSLTSDFLLLLRTCGQCVY